MKLLILQDQIYKSGGLERVLSLKIEYWLKNRSDIELLIVTNENENKAPFFEEFEGVKLIDLEVNYNKSKSLFSFENVLKSARHFLKLREIMNSYRPDIVIVCGFGFDFYFLPIVRKRAKIIKENHSSRFNIANESFFGKIKSKFRKIVEAKYDVLLFLSQEESDFVSLTNSYVIPNPIKLNQSRNICKRNNIVISAGRIYPIKGYERLVDAWVIVSKQVPDWRLEIYGDGEADYVEILKKRAMINGVSNSIEIFQSTLDIQTKMNESKIYAMSSLSECFPMVLLEAMQSYLPIIAFDCPTGPRNILNHNQTGLLVKDGDIILFAEQMIKLIQDDEFQHSLAEAAFVDSKKYGLDNIMNQWDGLFTKLLKS